jgi:acetoacetyl-CoA synthetase
VDAPLWTPRPDRAAASSIARFRSANGFAADDHEGLQQWSIDQPEAFWPALWRFVGMPGEPEGPVLVEGATLREARFFPDTSLNVAEVILAGRGASPDAPMLVAVDEVGTRRVFTRAEVRTEVGAAAAALRAEGVEPGDRVVAWSPNGIETMVLMLAAASIGAVFSSTSPDFGVDGVLDRFGQIRPVLLVAVESYRYDGREFDRREVLGQIRAGLPTLRRTVTLGEDWDRWLEPHRGTEPTFEPFPFDHPWYVLYSSGTTGVPKCIVHRTGGVLLQHLKEHQLHCDIGPGDRVLYFTTCGWMMWNWLASVPASGATAVLFDGSPFAAGPGTLFELAESEELTFLGVSAKFLDSVRKSGHHPGEAHRLGSVRTIASTGSPLAAETFVWVYENVASEVHLASISGGTDLCGCFVGGDPTRPVYAGEIQGPVTGMAVEIWGDDGEPAAVGERGDLVCVRPFPSMPLGFWGDDDGSRYRAAYFERFAGRDVWAQGDFATRTAHGGVVIHGRSDTTLNPGGVRIGTAEIYRQVEQIPEVVESLVFGQDWDGDTRIVLLVRLAEGAELDEGLVAEIKARIRTGCSPRHVPAVIAQVEDLPRTRSGKLAELAVADVVNGREVRNTSALANPETLEVIAALDPLRR